MARNAAPKGAKPWSRRLPHWTSVAAAIATAVLGVIAHRQALAWNESVKTLDALGTELATLTSQNQVLPLASGVLHNQKFQVCNKTPDTLTVYWLSAAYHDGHKLRVFDSSRCPGWRPQVLRPDDTKVFTASSTDEACNWSGAVMLYAFNFVRESEEQLLSYNVAGQWAGFERDCFTVQ
jgi:hypothetical protein